MHLLFPGSAIQQSSQTLNHNAPVKKPLLELDPCERGGGCSLLCVTQWMCGKLGNLLQEKRDRKNRVGMCLRKLQNALAAAAFGSWKAFSERRSVGREKLRAAVSLLANRLVATALRGWKVLFCHRSGTTWFGSLEPGHDNPLQDLQPVSIKHMRLQEGAKVQREVARKLREAVLKRMEAGTLSAFRSWRAASMQLRSARRMLHLSLARLKSRTMHAAFASWRGRVGSRAAKQEAANMCIRVKTALQNVKEASLDYLWIRLSAERVLNIQHTSPGDVPTTATSCL